MRKIYLYGAGGHAKVIIDILQSNDIEVAEIFDDNLNINQFMDIPVVHDIVNFPLIISIGNNAIRKKVTSQLSNAVYCDASFSKNAIISESVKMHKGTVVMQSAVIQSSTVIGEHVIVNTGSTIDHDCIIHDFVHIAPGANLCGNVEVGEGTLIGAGSIVIPGIKIGDWCTIGAGTVVTKNIPSHSTVVGNPARIINNKLV